MENSKLKINEVIEQERQLVLQQFLKNAPFDGWSEACLRKASSKSGFAPGYASLLFQDGVDGLTKYFHQMINSKMAEEFSAALVTKVHEKVIYMLEARFKLYQPYKEAIRALVKYKLKPQNLLTSKKLLWDTCSQIWYLAGDKSTDFNYYSKRGLLAAVYSSSLIYWLNDESEKHEKTKEFIQNRIQNVLSFGRLKQSGMSFLKRLF